MFHHVYLSMVGNTTAGYTQVTYSSALDTVSIRYGTHEVRMSVLDAAAMADAIIAALDAYTSDMQVVW